jgi:thioesterase domain-containing protein
MLLADTECPDVTEPLNGASERAPFYCVPGIGGNVLHLNALAQRMSQAQHTLVALRASFSADSDRPDTVEDIAARTVASMLKRRSYGPFLLGGYSAGASIAFEMARQLTAQGLEVALLALIDTRSPGWRVSARRAPAVAASFVSNLPGWMRDDLAQSSAQQVFKDIRRHMRRIAGAGTAVERVLDVSRYSIEQQIAMQREYEVLEAYRPAPWSGRIALLRAETQPLLLWHDEPALGWSALARGGVEIVRIPGNHSTIMREPHVGALASAVGACMAAATSPRQQNAS